MQPIWLVEAGVYGEEVTALLTEIRHQNMIAEVIQYQALRTGAVVTVAGRTLGKGSCVIGYGTFPFARQIQLHHAWAPGAWCDVENLDCRRYAEHFGPFLLNREFKVLPGAEAIRRHTELFDEFAVDDEVFVRPTACDKLFVGRRMTRDHFPTGLALTRYDPATTVLIAGPKEIDREWRIIVSGDRVISGSQYAIGGKRDVVFGIPADVRAYAENVLSQIAWRPDPIFMLDIGESESGLWIVELNSFSTSWLYQPDLAAVVSEASKLARDI